MCASGLVGNGFLHLLDICKRKVIQSDCTFVPSAASLYCMGIEVLTPRPGGFDFTALDKYRLAHPDWCTIFTLLAACLLATV